MNTSGKWLFGSWATLTVLAGSILMSFHQPFRAPTPAILQLIPPQPHSSMRVLHVLSASCGCSRRVMQHLIERDPLSGVTEQIVILDGPGPDLPDTERVITSLIQKGFHVRRMLSTEIPSETKLRGVPLLVFAAPDDSILYMGGYGPGYDQDAPILHQIEKKQTVQPLPTIGCAVSRTIRSRADPFHLKY